MCICTYMLIYKWFIWLYGILYVLWCIWFGKYILYIYLQVDGEREKANAIKNIGVSWTILETFLKFKVTIYKEDKKKYLYIHVCMHFP